MNIINEEIFTNETDIGNLSIEKIEIESLQLSIPIYTRTFITNTSIVDELSCPSVLVDELTCLTVVSDTTQVDVLDANIVNTTVLNATTLDSTSFDGGQISCNVINTEVINCQSVSSKYYETKTFTTLDAEIIQDTTLATTPTRVASTFKNGLLDTVVEYKVINNAPSLFSDLQLATDSTGTNTLFIYGDVINSTESLPRIIGYNTPLGTYDNNTGYGGKTAYLSLCSDSSGTAKTLRYERDGKLTLYTNTGAIFWQSSNLVSDIRDKENIEPISENCTEQILSLKGYYYNYKGEGERQIGLIAQDVLPVFPEAILRANESKDALLSLDYTKLIPALIEALKEVANETEHLLNK